MLGHPLKMMPFQIQEFGFPDKRYKPSNLENSDFSYYKPSILFQNIHITNYKLFANQIERLDRNDIGRLLFGKGRIQAFFVKIVLRTFRNMMIENGVVSNTL
jgi:hypothetical protein